MKMTIRQKRTQDTEYILYEGEKYSTLFVHNFITHENSQYSFDNKNLENNKKKNKILSFF